MNELNNLNISEFWRKFSDMKYSDESLMFPTLCIFIFNIMCLPHSSATVERVFSVINLNKTKIRNKLSTETDILHTKTLLKNLKFFSFIINQE